MRYLEIRRTMVRALFAAVLLASLAACSGGRLIYNNQTAGLLGYFASAAADGTVGVVVIAPPATPPETVAAIVAAMERSGGWGQPARYVLRSPAEARAEPYFVVMLDPPRSQTGSGLCAGAKNAPGEAGDQGVQRLQMVFCAGDRRLSEAEGTTARDSTALAGLVGQAMLYLVPATDPELGYAYTTYN